MVDAVKEYAGVDFETDRRSKKTKKNRRQRDEDFDEDFEDDDFGPDRNRGRVQYLRR